MIIENSTEEDITEIFQLYHEATEYMKGRSLVVWPRFDRDMVQREIAAKHQWKMMHNNSMACIWATTFSDEQIWEERNADAALYIHRIAVHPHFRGKNLVLQIVEWAKLYALANHKKFIRLDTVGDNKGLIKHYTNCGFDFLGLFRLKNTAGLPPHYDKATVSLFQLAVKEN